MSRLTINSTTVRVEVITLILYHAAELGSYFYVEPSFESALQDIKTRHPDLTFRQSFVYDPVYKECGKLLPYSDDLLARYYYAHESR